MSLWVAALILAAEPGFCSMSEAEANQSPQCIRYYFECQDMQSRPTGRFANLDPMEIIKLKHRLAFTLAARNCQHFSYVEAEAALRGYLRWQ